jgi:hypothetical protein
VPAIERSAAGSVRLRAVDSAPGGCCVFRDLGNTGRLQHTVGTVDEWLMAGGSLVSDFWR